MALFENFKNAAKGYVEGHLGAQQPVQSEPAQKSQPETEVHTLVKQGGTDVRTRQEKFADGVRSAMSWGKKRDANIQPPEEDIIPQLPQTLSNPLQRILALSVDQSKAALQETQNIIDETNSGPERVMDLATGKITDNVSIAQTPADLGLSKATSNAPPVPLNTMPTGQDPATVTKNMQVFQKANAMRMPGATGTGTSSNVFAKFRKGADGNVPDLTYADEARSRVNRQVDMLEEVTKRWAMARSGRDYVKGMHMDDIPAAALILAMKEVPTPAYVTEAQKYYQTAVTQYGHDISVLKEAAKQDEALRAAINTKVAFANERANAYSAARDLNIPMSAYTNGEQIVLFEQDGARSISGADKDTAERMQKQVDQITKGMEEFDKRVEKGEDVSKLTGSVVQTWNNAVMSGSIDANTGYSRILGYLGHENTWTSGDRVLAAKLRGQGLNPQSITTAIAINHIPSLKQKFMQMAELNKQAGASGVGKMTGGALNTMYSSADAATVVNAMNEIEVQRFNEAHYLAAIRHDNDRALNASVDSLDRTNALFEGSATDVEAFQAWQDFGLVNDGTNDILVQESRGRLRNAMVNSKQLNLRMVGSVLFDGFGESAVEDRMELLQNDKAISKAAGDNKLLTMALNTAAEDYRAASGLHDANTQRKNLRRMFAENKGKPIGELITKLQEAKIMEGVTKAQWETAMTAAERVSPRASKEYADEVLRRIDAATYSASLRSPRDFLVTETSLQTMRNVAQNYGTSISERDIRTAPNGQLYVRMSPQRMALYSALEQVTPAINALIAAGKKPTVGMLKNALAENPQQLAAYETLCGADIEATMEKYANNLWQKHVGEMEAQARMQRVLAAQPQAYTGGGNGR